MNEAMRRAGLVVGFFGLVALGCGNNNSSGSPDSGADLPADVVTPGDTSDAVVAKGSDLVVDHASITVVEGDPLGSTFMVTLAKPFPTQVTVNVTTSDRTVASVAQDTLVFPANDVGPQIVTVLGTPDDDTVSNSALVTLSAQETGTATVHVTVTDINKQAIVVSPTQVSMQQGETTQVGVRLAFRPSVPVTVTVTSPAPALLAVTPATLTFAADSTYSIPQPVTLTATAGGAVGNQTVVLGVAATGVDTVLPLSVFVSDPNTLGLVVTPGSLSLTEGGTPGNIMVSLSKAPPTDLVVSITSTSNAIALPSPVAVTFNASNYATPQVVTVTPQANNDPKNEVATITFAVTTAVVPSVASRTVAVTVVTDQNQSIQVLPAAVTVNQGASTTFDVWFAFNPGSAVTVNAFSSNPARLTVTPPNLIFNPSNFGTHQKVTVQGLAGDDLTDVMASITLTSVAANSVTVPVTIKNTNAQAIQVVYGSAPNAIVMQETQMGGVASSTTFGVNLAYNPGADVTVTLNADDATRLTISKSLLTFNPTGGKSPGKTTQFVTLTSVHDADIVDNTVTLTVSAPGLASVTVPVIILDMDVERFTVTQAGTPISSIDNATEGQMGGVTFQVALTQLPPIPITATLTSSDPARAMVAPSVSFVDMMPQTITVALPKDADAKPNTVTITIHATTSIPAIPDRTVTISIADVDTQGILVDPSNLTIHESMAPNSASFTVALKAQPISDTVVGLSISPFDGVSLATPGGMPKALTFTTANWMIAQTVTVSGIPDANLSTDQFTIRISAPDLAVADQFVYVTEIDDDMQGLAVSTMDIGSLAQGADGTFKVHLLHQPLTITTVTVTVPPDVIQSFGLASPTFTGSSDFGATSLTLTFSPNAGVAGGYDVDQTVDVKAKVDPNTDNEVTNIVVSLPSFAGSQPVKVSSIDGDVQAILISVDNPLAPAGAPLPDPVTLSENFQRSEANPATSQEFWVRLKYPPHGAAPNEVIAINESPMNNKVSFSVPTLTFSAASGLSGGWDQRQKVTVTAVPDSDTQDVMEVVKLSTQLVGAMGDNLWHAPDAQFNVKVNDLDVGITYTPSSGTVSEAGGTTQAFDVRLTKLPTADVTVTVQSSDGNKATVSPGTLTFSTANGTTSQPIVVTGQANGDTSNQTIMITLTSTDLGVTQSRSIPVTVTP